MSRRAVFAGAALCGLTGALAACGSAEPPAAVPSVSPSAPTLPPPGSLLVAAAEVPVGGGVVAANTVIVVQPAAGQFKAFDRRCPHMGALVGTPDSNGAIVCPLHKARFQASDGTRVSGPGTTGLTLIPVDVVNGQIRRSA